MPKELFGDGATYALAAFKVQHDAIVANCWNDNLADVAEKVHARGFLKWD